MTKSATRSYADELGIDDNATSTAITIDASENVGIGTTSPDEMLHVMQSSAGAVTAHTESVIVAEANGNCYFSAIGTTSAGLLMANTSGNEIGRINYSFSENSMQFYANNAEVMRIRSGNVGVGTASPAKPLDVTGDIRTSTGILFGTDTAAANTLSDYETGTWTPSFVSVNSTSPTGVFAHAGSYTKIGRTVSICCYMQVSSGLSAGGGTLAIAGIPFSSIDSNGHRATSALLASRWDPDRTENIGVSIYDANRLGFLTSNHDSAWNWEQTGTLNNQTNMRFSMTYFTNS